MPLNHISKITDLIPQPISKKIRKIPLLFHRILIPHLKVLRQPPRGFRQNIPFRSRYKQLSFRLYTNPAFRQRHPMCIHKGRLRIQINSIPVQDAVKPHAFITSPHQLHNRQQRMAPKFGKPSAIFPVRTFPQLFVRQSCKTRLDVTDLSDHAAFCDTDQLYKSGTICRFNSLQQYKVFSVCQCKQLLRL